MGMRIIKQKTAESKIIFKAADNHKTHGQDRWDANVCFKDAKQNFTSKKECKGTNTFKDARKNFTNKKKCNGTDYICGDLFISVLRYSGHAVWMFRIFRILRDIEPERKASQ